MLKTVEAVRERERERELQFREESNSKKQSTSTKLCKQQYLLDSLERETNFSKLDFNFCAQNTVFDGIGLLERLQINRVKIEKRMDYMAT